MIAVRELTVPMALELAANLDARHRAEISAAYPNLEHWAIERCTLPGVAWALLKDGQVMLACGVLSNGATAMLWLAGREGWRRYIKHPLRIWRAVLEAGAFERFECQCGEDNAAAQRFAEYLGFARISTSGGFVNYGRAA